MFQERGLADSGKSNYEKALTNQRFERAGFQFFYSFYSKSVTA